MARFRKVLAITGAMLACLVLVGWVATHPQTRDPYKFLEGRPLVDVTVRGPGSWPATECRFYSWKGSWVSVARAARDEMRSFGLTERTRVKASDLSVSWTTELIDGGLCGKSAELSVHLTQGRFTLRTERDQLTDRDPEWVTVQVSNFLDESWITVLRYTFFGFGR